MIRAGFAILSRTAPTLGARLAETLFFTPPRPQKSPRIGALQSSGRRFEVSAGGRRVRAWSWGDGPPVYLVHGWGGQGGQLGEFVPPLVEHGLIVIDFDAPGHGASAGGRSSLLEFHAALRALVEARGAGHGVVAHSFGAPAAAFALHRGLPLGRAVFVAPPASPADWTRRFGQRFGIAPALLVAMQARSERRLGVRWDELDLTVLARDLTTPLLVVHDENDHDVPWSDGALVASAWPGARLLTTRGLGHRRVLKDPTVVEAVTRFLAAGRSDRDTAASAAPTPEHAERSGTRSNLLRAAALETYLFRRDTRWGGPALDL